MKIRYILLILIVVIFLIIIVKPKQKLVFDKIVDQAIYFSNGKQFETNLYDLKYIGQLQTKNKVPYLILSGRTCQECDENISIYVYSPSDGQMKNESERQRYSYPGKEFNYSNNKLVFESRMFYGKCLSDDRDSVVWIQKELNNENKFEIKTFIIEVIEDKLKETIMDDNLLINDLIKNCNELPGIDIVSEP